MENADTREPNAIPTDLEKLRQTAAAALREQVPGVRIDFDEITGGPKNITAVGKFLSPPAADGRIDEVVARFVDVYRDLFGHGSLALKGGNSRITRDDTAAHNGQKTVVWQQELDGIPFFQTILRASLTKNGELITLGGNYLGDPAAATRLDADQRAALIANPPVAATRAIVLAAADIDTVVDEKLVSRTDGPQGIEKKQEFQAPAISDTRAGLAWVPMSAGSARLAWDVIIMSIGRGEMFRVLVDAENGAILVRQGLTNYITPASYRVYAKAATKQPHDSPTPLSPGHPTPLTTQPPLVTRELVTLDALNTTASPNGWIDDGGTATIGNNVAAHTDSDANPNVPDLPRPTSATRTFDFPVDFANAPAAYKDAAVTQLFYLNNWVHDKLYELGFTESAGNFQTNNFSRGGQGNDAVLADAQDGSGTNNANFSTPPDGSPGRMQMYIFTGPTPDIDGDLDAEIVIHEYAHGLSNRLVGGGVGISANQSQGLGEGWSDFYGLALLSEVGDDVHGDYAAGGYATRQFSSLTQNYYFGIRRYPYSTDLLKNPLTFKDIDPTQASSHAGIPRSPIIGSSANAVHNQGEVWCATLWDLRANLITRHGYAIGNTLALQLVTDGMKLAPANPNFLQARDSIIQADLVNQAGANQNELWTAFAKRGMGASATSPSSSTTIGLIESYDIPDNLSVIPYATFDAGGQIAGTISPTSQTYTLHNSGPSGLNWTASKSQAWLTLSASAGVVAPGADATVIVTFNAAANALPAGSHTGNVTFTNTASGATLNRTVNLTIEPFYNSIFAENFESGTLGSAWTISGTASHRTFVTSVNAPRAGTHHLTMDSSVDDNYSRNEATLALNLAGRERLVLNFWVKMFNDEGNPPATNPFTGGADFDGIAVSSDGGTIWHEIRDLRTLSNSWQKISIDLDAAVAARGLTYTANFKIRFNHYDNYGISTDGFAFDDILVAEVLDKALTITAANSATEGGAAVTATLSVTPVPAANVTVALSSGSANATVPASVIVPSGSGSATFQISPVDDALLDGSQSAVITATAATYPNGTKPFIVHDNETAILSLEIPESVIEGSSPPTGLVNVSAPIDSAVAVTLTSDSPSALLPATVTIPAGATSAQFSIILVNDSQINGDRPAMITASVQGWTPAGETMTILDEETSILSLTLPVLREGDTGKTAAATLSGTLAADLVVALASSDSSALTVPATVTIPAGQSGTLIPLTIVDDAMADGAQPVTLTATAAGFPDATVTGSVEDNDAHNFTIAPITGPVLRNGPVAVSITARDINGVTITNFAQTLNFSAADGSLASVPVTPPSAGGFTNGLLTVNLAFAAYGTDVTLTAQNGGGHAGTSNAFDVVTGELDHFTWSAIPPPQAVDAPFQATVRAEDAAGNPLPSFTGPVNLAAVNQASVGILSWTAYADTATGGEYAKTKQAISAGFSNYHESATTTTSAATLASQLAGKNVFLIVEQESGSPTTLGALGTEWAAVLNSFVITGGTVIACSNTTSEHLILANSGLLAVTPVSSPSSSAITKVADTPINAGVAVPFTGTNLHTYTTTTGTVDLQTTTGEAVVISRTVGAGRVVLVGTDFNSPGSGMDRALANAVALAAPPSPAGQSVSPATTGSFTDGEWTGAISVPFAAPALVLRATADTLTADSNPFAVIQPRLSSGAILTEDFETATLNPARWASTGTGNFRTQVTSSYSPHGGTNHLAMDSTSGFARNEATLTLNLDGHSGVVLKFWAAGYSDEPNGPPASPFFGGADFDGVAISADGSTWWEVQGLRSLSSTHTQFTVDLDAAIAARGISYGPDFKIRFNQYDDFPLSTDGIVIDDILVTASAAASDLAFALPPQVTEGAGTVSGSISLQAPAQADLTVKFASRSPSKISVPESVTITAGQTSAVVFLGVAEDPFVDGTKDVILTAEAPGHVAIEAAVNVLDNDGGTLGLNVPATASENAGIISGSVSLDKASLAPVVIALSSDLPSAAMVPVSVTVPAGASSVGFTITIPEDTVVDDDQTVHLTAIAPGWSPAAADLLVKDNESRDLVLSIPPVFRETDAPRTGTVSLGGIVASPLVISLSSGDTSEMTVPASVTIPAGQSSAPFNLTAQDDVLADGPQPFTVTASAATFNPGQATGTVRDNEAHHFTFEAIGSPQLKNGPVPAIITARHADGAVARDCTSAFLLSATSDSGPLAVSPESGGAFINGIWSGSVQIDALATNVVLTADDGSGHLGSSNPFDLVGGLIDRFEWNAIPASQTLDTPFTATVRAVESSGATATGFNGIARLFVLAASANPVIGSGSTTSSNTISTYQHDSRCDLLYTAAELAGEARLTALALNVTSVPTSLALTNWTIRLKHSPLTSLGSVSTWDNSGWTTVYRASPVISASGWVTYTFSTPFDYNGTSNLLVDVSMDRSSTTSAYTYVQASSTSNPLTLYASSNNVNGDPLTWSGSTPYPNISYQRADIRFSTTKELSIRPEHSSSFVNGVWTGQVSVPVSGNGLNLKAKAGTVTGSSNNINVAAPTTHPSGGTTIFAEDFESGSLNPAWWASTGTGSFRTQVTTSFSPHGGTRHLAMDTTTGAARNEATLTTNLAGRSGVVLKFWAAGYSDEATGPPASPFTGGADFDGLAISANGSIWWEIQGLRSLPSTYGQFTVDLDAAIAALGIGYNSAFKIRFNQFDDTSLTSDGIVIDDILITANPISGYFLTAPAHVTEGDPPGNATVTLDAAAVADTVITLASSAPAKLAVPASVTVPAGLTSATFVLTTPDDNISDGNRPVFITGTIGASPPRSTLVNVLDNETLPLFLTAPNTLAEGATGQTGTLTLGAASSATLTVNLASSDTSEITVPATVVFQPGQTVAFFPLTVVNDTLIDGTQLATVTAAVSGWFEESLTIQVTDNEARNLSHSAPYSVYEGTSASGSVSISGTLPGDLIVALESLNPAQLSVPASVTIPAGQTSASYQATAIDDTATDGTQTVTISAVAATFATAYSNAYVYDNDIHHFGFPTISSPQQSGTPFNITVYARDINNVTISTFSSPARLTATGDAGPLALATTGSVNFNSGSWSGIVTCPTADTNVRITATGSGVSGTSNAFQVLQSPAITVTPASLSLTLNQGSTTTRGIAIRNTGGGTLNWSIGTVSSLAGLGESAAVVTLANSLANLNSNSATVSALIPNRYPFTDGVTGTSINDGGGDMYDAGNILNTNLGSSLPYSDNFIASSAILGAGGQYYTRKYDGLWVFAANIAGLSYFEVTGGLGADGFGATDSTVLSLVRNGTTYRGFVKRVYNTSTPSVNHLVIIEDNGTATHETSTDTNNDYHRVSGLTGVTRIYEVLYAGSSGTYIDNTTTLAIMTAFIDAVSVPAWVTAATTSGSIPAGGVQNVTLNISAANLTVGSHTRTIFVGSNDPAQPQSGIPISLTVTNNGNLAITPVATATASGPRGGNFAPASHAYTLTNTGGLPLDWTASRSVAWLDLAPAAGTLAPGGSTTVTATFNSTAASLTSGIKNASLAFSNTTFGLGNTSRTITLTIVPAGEMAVTPAGDFVASGPLGSPVTPESKSYVITNPGDATINWTTSRTGAWLSLSSSGGTLAAGASETVTATISTAGINPGNHPGSISFTNTTNHRGNTSRAAALTISLPAPVPVAEPPFTPGTSNTIAWSAVPAADSYEVQATTDWEFRSIAAAETTIGTSTTFPALDDGTPYLYRIRTLLDAPGGPIPSPWSNVVSSTQDASPPALVRGTALTTANPILFPHGSANDAGAGVGQIMVNGGAVQFDIGSGSWAAAPLLLLPGDNVIVITASDLLAPPNTIVENWTTTYTGSATSDADGDSLPDEWETSHGLNPADNGTYDPLQGAYGDPDGDLISNLMEYALGLDPSLHDSSGLPTATLEINATDGKQYLTFQHRRRVQRDGIHYLVETATSPDASSWNDSSTGLEEFSSQPTGDGITELRTVRILPATDLTTRKLVRLKVVTD